MSLQKIKDFFKAKSIWEQIAAGVILAIILGIWGLWWHLKPKSEPPVVVIEQGPNSVSQTAVGDNVHQVLKIDKSRSPSGGIYIERVEPGAIVNINVINYVDGLPQAENAEVREIFAKGREYYVRGEFEAAIEEFRRCLSLEEDSEKRGALNLQIGNCYYQQQLYLKAHEFYAAGLRESRKAKDLQGEASNLVGIANTYILRPASSGKVRGDNVRKAVEHYNSTLKVFNRDEYPVEYAGTQNSLGTAYIYLPSATAEEQAENVRQAIECYKAALEIRKKDEYPVKYAMTQNDLGAAYTYLPSATAEQRAENVRKAIECYKAALEIRKKDEYPVDYATTQNNLGIAYRDLPSATSEERAENVRQAIECCKTALEIRKKDEYPVKYATTQNNLGAAYRDLPSATAEERAENIRKAIECCKAALEIYKKDEYPVEYAGTQNNLGAAYRDLPSATAEERVENIRKAIECYKTALEISKKNEYPQYYCQTAANLGLALASINNPDACYWLKEAYALREYLEDQGKRLEELIRQVCKKEQR